MIEVIWMSSTFDNLLVPALVKQNGGGGESGVPAERYLGSRREPPESEPGAGGKRVAVPLDPFIWCKVTFTVSKERATCSLSQSIRALSEIPLSWCYKGGLRKVHLGRNLLLELVGNVGGEETNGGGISGWSPSRGNTESIIVRSGAINNCISYFDGDGYHGT